jgi:hypothetical protein
LTSDVFALCPRNFGDASDPGGAARRRGLVTLGSFDPDRPGITPWFWPANPTAYDRLKETALLPSGPPVAFPPLTNPLLIPPESEFGPDGRAAAGFTMLRRLDLNRYLPDYPKPDVSGVITDLLGFNVAQTARQHFAAEIFERLWKATGTGDPNLIGPPRNGEVGLRAERWEALRSLAQLAVNIVDFIDNDDYITPFNWYPPSPRNPPGEWVFGTELPRLVLNEAYVQYDNDPNDPGLQKGGGGVQDNRKATYYNVNVWVELYNPFPKDDSLADSGAAMLQNRQIPVYQVVLSRGGADLRRRNNVRGIPAYPIKATANFGADPQKWRVEPSDGQFAGEPGGTQGFYVLGPRTQFISNALPKFRDLPNADPKLPATLSSPDMTFQVRAFTPVMQKPTIVLRRLACPHLPPNELPGLSAKPYNPYVTIDYVEDVPTNDGRLFNATGLIPVEERIPMAARASWGRSQPYAAHPTRLKRQVSNAILDRPQNSFFRHNSDLDTPFDWLVHLDRPLISPMELLHVSAFKPHELTQQFMTGSAPAQRFNHLARWLDDDQAPGLSSQSHRLYRIFEFLGTRNQTLGMMQGGTRSLDPIPNQYSLVRPLAMLGRTASGGSWQIQPGATLVIEQGTDREEIVRVRNVFLTDNPPSFTADFQRQHPVNFTITPATMSERIPGKVNINTVWDADVFQALSDAQPSNGFNNTELISTIFHQLKASRTLGVDGGPETPGGRDRPFRSLAAGFTPYDDSQFPNSGLQDTILRSGSSDGRPILAVPGAAHHYQSYELLTKIFNNITTRSNVFAVWVTVGFFEVTDDTAPPVKLGREIGREENRHVRHRMFAIVDRSVLTRNPGPREGFRLRDQGSESATGLVVPFFSVID